MSDPPSRSVVVDASKSSNARLKPVPISAVTFTDDFWAPRLRINREVTLPTQYQLLEETGRIDNFRAAADKDPAQYGRSDIDRFVRSGAYYNDSDVYKWLEAASWVLATDPDAAAEGRPLSQVVDDVIAELAGARRQDRTHEAGEQAQDSREDE